MNLSDLAPAGYIQVGAQAFWSTSTFTAAKAGIALVTIMGGGASGTKTALPGNSAPWGVKAIRMNAGDVLTFNIAAAIGGSSGAAIVGNTSTVQLNGVNVMVASGGEANSSTTSFTAVAATVTGADFVMKGRQPAGAKSQCGGAAVDLGYGTCHPGGLVGDSSIAHMHNQTLGAPLGAYIPAFDLTIPANVQGYAQPGEGSSSEPRLSILFGGGNSTINSTTTYPAGRGGSGGTAWSSGVAAAAGGAGYGYLRFFVKP